MKYVHLKCFLSGCDTYHNSFDIVKIFNKIYYWKTVKSRTIYHMPLSGTDQWPNQTFAITAWTGIMTRNETRTRLISPHPHPLTPSPLNYSICLPAVISPPGKQPDSLTGPRGKSGNSSRTKIKVINKRS